MASATQRPALRARVVPLVLGLGLAVSLTACSSAAAGSNSSSSSDSSTSTVAVVASTNVYGDIVSQIGGDRVSVTSIIDDPSKDPHEYQADAQNQLAVSKAALVVENGGGYDDFIDTMVSSAKNPSVMVVNAATVSGYDLQPATGSFNEHLWYDFPTVIKVVDEISKQLSAIDPAGASSYAANAAAFDQKVQALESTEAQLKTTYQGQGAAITEPVPLYMLDAIGLVDKTPEKFSEAVENGTDVAPDVLASVLALFAAKQVAVLAYNSQTSGPQTDAVVNAATAAGTPVVPVTETLPAGDSYLQWMSDNLTALSTALAK